MYASTKSSYQIVGVDRCGVLNRFKKIDKAGVNSRNIFLKDGKANGSGTSLSRK